MDKLIERSIEQELLKFLDRKEIIAIRGPRQSGKTTILKKISKELKGNVHYATFEDDFELEKFEKNPKEYISFNMKEGKNFFLLDEIQYVKNAGKILKLIYDTMDIKMIITGSSSLDVQEIGSYLVGRIILFELYPFSFEEFLKAKGEKFHKYYLEKKFMVKGHIIKKEELIYLKELNEKHREFLTYGGYPAIVLESNVEKKKKLLSSLFQTYIEKDIVRMYGLKKRQRIIDLIRHLAAINTSMINYNEMASSLSIYDREVKEIISILEQTYIIRTIKPYHKNLATELKKNPKVYFVDSGLRNISTGRFDFSDEEFGKLLENNVLNLFRDKSINYWRTTAKAEVDFIYEGVPIESKIVPKITRSLRSYIESYKPKTAVIANLKEYWMEKIGTTCVLAIPHALLYAD